MDAKVNRCRGLYALRGFIYAGLSSVMGSIIAVTIKTLKNFSAIEIVFYTAAITAILCLPLALFRVKSLPSKSFWLQTLFRSINQIFLSIGRFMTYKLLPIGEAQVILMNQVFFVAIIGRIFMKEKISRLTMIALALTAVGMVLVCNVPELMSNKNEISATNRLIGIAAALVATLSMSIFIPLLQKASQYEFTLIIFVDTFATSLILLIVSSFMGGITIVKTCTVDPWLFMVVGVFGLIVFILILLACKTEIGSSVALIRMGADLLLGFLWQLGYFGERVDVLVGVGAGLVFLGTLLPALRKWLLSKPEEYILRQKLHILLK